MDECYQESTAVMTGLVGQIADGLLKRRLVAKQMARTALLYPVCGMATFFHDHNQVEPAVVCATTMIIADGRRIEVRNAGLVWASAVARQQKELSTRGRLSMELRGRGTKGCEREMKCELGGEKIEQEKDVVLSTHDRPKLMSRPRTPVTVLMQMQMLLRR